MYEAATRRYSLDREEAIAAIGSPARRLGTALRMAVPAGPEDIELRMLFEFDAMIFSDPRYLDYARRYQDRQVRMYEQVLTTASRPANSPSPGRPATWPQPARPRGLARLQRADRGRWSPTKSPGSLHTATPPAVTGVAVDRLAGVPSE